MIVDNLYKSIERGKQGLNNGLSTGLSKLDTLVYGVQRKWMTIWAGDSGIAAVYMRNYIKNYWVKSVKTVMLIPR